MSGDSSSRVRRPWPPWRRQSSFAPRHSKRCGGWCTARVGKPVVVSVEDVHWIDATSEALLESLAESLGGTAMLLVATYRAGYRPPWMNTSYATQVALPPLSPHDSRHVVRAVMGSHVMPESVTEQLLKRAEGNPFFLEELSRVALVPGAPAVPDTVHAVLQTRIDRLSDVPRQLRQTAAVIGREVPKTLLQATGQAVESLAGLDELKHSEFLHERPSASGPVYVFKHALTQEVAYASVPSERQRTLHCAVGRALESRGGPTRSSRTTWSAPTSGAPRCRTS